MDAEQVSPGVSVVNGAGADKASVEGLDQAKAFVASLEALARIWGDVAEDRHAREDLRLQDNLTLAGAVAAQGAALGELARNSDDFLDGMECCESVALVMDVLCEGLRGRESITESEAWAVSFALSAFTARVGEWATEWYGDAWGVATH